MYHILFEFFWCYYKCHMRVTKGVSSMQYNYSTSQIDRGALMTTHVATEAAKICCNIAAESWMPIHNGSYSRHLIQCKNHEFL